MNGVPGKDNLSTLIKATIFLLLFAIFLPPLFRWIYSDETTGSTFVSDAYTLKCVLNEELYDGFGNKKLSESINIQYGKDKKTKNMLSFTFEMPSNLNETAKSQCDKICSDYDYLVLNHSNNKMNTNRIVYKFNFKESSINSDQLISKYAGKADIDSQLKENNSNGFSCSIDNK